MTRIRVEIDLTTWLTETAELLDGRLYVERVEISLPGASNPPPLSLLKTHVLENAGDHAQDVVVAHVADPDETLGKLAERLLVGSGYNPNGNPENRDYLTIRIATGSTPQ